MGGAGDSAGGRHPDGEGRGVEGLGSAAMVAMRLRPGRSPGMASTGVWIAGQQKTFQRRHPNHVFDPRAVRFGPVQHGINKPLDGGRLLHATTVPPVNQPSPPILRWARERSRGTAKGHWMSRPPGREFDRSVQLL